MVDSFPIAIVLFLLAASMNIIGDLGSLRPWRDLPGLKSKLSGVDSLWLR
jgi:hypothetical protein